MTETPAPAEFTVERVLKRRKLDKLIEQGKYREANALARDLGVELPTGVVDLQTERDRH